MITLDVRNAFNPAIWDHKRTTLNGKTYQVTYTDYLNDRHLQLGKKHIKIEAGVPNGSLLDPSLWKTLLDNIFQVE